MYITGTCTYEPATRRMILNYDGDFYPTLRVEPQEDTDYQWLEADGRICRTLPAVYLTFNPKTEKRGELMQIIEGRVTGAPIPGESR